MLTPTDLTSALLNAQNKQPAALGEPNPTPFPNQQQPELPGGH